MNKLWMIAGFILDRAGRNWYKKGKYEGGNGRRGELEKVKRHFHLHE